jgi:catechol 2,3-dioxygenase-like lactoylglutathione lyase family enzyme
MHIAHVDLVSTDVATAAEFYAGVLGQSVTVATGSNSATVRIGTSTLTLRRGTASVGINHLAFTIPANRFAEAKAWLSSRVALLTKDGADKFSLGGTWNSESVYFPGPDGSILELIARHSLDNATAHPFTGADLLCVSEIGLGVPDVPGAVDALEAQFGLARFGDGGDQFSPVGDHDGLLILVSQDRPWFPSADLIASRGPLTVTLTDVKPGAMYTPTGGQVLTSI